jgi:DNA repair protein RadC
MNYTTSKTQAIKLAKEILKQDHSVKRLNSSITNTSCSCGCGESPAIKLSTLIKGDYFDIIIGICKVCNKGTLV